MKIAARVFLAVSLFVLLARPGGAAGRGALLGEELPPLTDSQKALKAVPFAPGAPAVVLSDVRQYRWFKAGDEYALKITDYRRVKILTEAGVSKFGDYSLELFGDWRLKAVLARTVLPDGTVVDAKDGTFHETSDDGDQVIRVAFPRVAVGAVLDVFVTVAADDAWGVAPFELQKSIPVLESRLVMIPPEGLRYRTATARMDPTKNMAERIRLPGGDVAFAWTFTDVPALEDEPNLPPVSDVSRVLYVIAEEFRNEWIYVPLARDWESWGQARTKHWNEWMSKGSHSAADALAKEVCAGKTTPAEKAEAIRTALRSRVRLDYLSAWTNRENPDEVLSKGAATSGAIAATTVAMLKAAGVTGHLMAIRRRSSGRIPGEFPVPVLLDDLLVRIPGEKEPLLFSPVADLPVGGLPLDCTNILAFPLDGKAKATITIPDTKAAENKVTRETEATLAADGTIAGTSRWTFHGAAAERWRRRLRDRNADARIETVRGHVRAHLPGARVTSLDVDALAEADRDLVLKIAFDAENAGTVAGKRLLLNPNLWSRISPADWSAAKRSNDIELGANFEEKDLLTLSLPEAVTEVTLPAPARHNAGPVGLYTLAFDRKPGKLTVERGMRLEAHIFPAASFTGLKAWFGAIAESDDSPLALTIGSAQ